MSRICLVGVGVPAFVPSRFHAGPGLRAAHFATSLLRRGHEILVVSVVPASTQDRSEPVVLEHHRIEDADVSWLRLTEAEFAAAAAVPLVGAFRPQAFVGVTTFGANLATCIAGELPLWADVFGDPMAEAQAKAMVHANDVALGRFWTTLLPVLVRADRFSAVSRAQADALIGQLGIAGRLSAKTAGEEMVSVIPCAAEAALTCSAGRTQVGEGGVATVGLRGTAVPSDAFLVLWSGSFNTWCDVETAFHGVERAMGRHPKIHFVATGGEVSGHDERSYSRFRELVRRSRHARRFHLLGWVEGGTLNGYYAESDVGLNVEREVYERRFGSENRVAHWAAHGLPAVTTARSEFGRTLAAERLCFPIAAADPETLADMLVSLADSPARAAAVGEACRRYAASHLTYDATADPLLEWVARPIAAGDHGAPRPFEVGLVSEPAAMVRMLEGYLAELSLGQVGYRSVRWLWRRLRASGPI